MKYTIEIKPINTITKVLYEAFIVKQDKRISCGEYATQDAAQHAANYWAAIG